MNTHTYIHGTSRRGQQRLINQAAQLSSLLEANQALRPGDQLLEIGCGVWAVLEQIGLAHPDVQLFGIDISPEQIEAARHHLSGLALNGVDLMVGDGAALPWDSDTTD